MSDFFEKVANLIEHARKYVGRTTDLTMCVTYFEVGRMIVEEEQGGTARAKYGQKLLVELSNRLKKRFGQGYSVSTLTSARKFYQIYTPSIQQAMLDESGKPKRQACLQAAMLTELEYNNKNQNIPILEMVHGTDI